MSSTEPKTAEGAGLFLQEVFRIANDLPDNRGAGVLVWEPANWQEMIDRDNSAWPKIKFHETIKVYEDSDAEYVLEDTVYRTVHHKDALKLPATVHLLTTAGGSTRVIPVAWEQAVRHVSTLPRCGRLSPPGRARRARTSPCRARWC